MKHYGYLSTQHIWIAHCLYLMGQLWSLPLFYNKNAEEEGLSKLAHCM